jgi:hypothetical protein
MRAAPSLPHRLTRAMRCARARPLQHARQGLDLPAALQRAVRPARGSATSRVSADEGTLQALYNVLDAMLCNRWHPECYTFLRVGWRAAVAVAVAVAAAPAAAAAHSASLAGAHGPVERRHVPRAAATAAGTAERGAPARSLRPPLQANATGDDACV